MLFLTLLAPKGRGKEAVNYLKKLKAPQDVTIRDVYFTFGRFVIRHIAYEYAQTSASIPQSTALPHMEPLLLAKRPLELEKLLKALAKHWISAIIIKRVRLMARLRLSGQMIAIEVVRQLGMKVGRLIN